MKLYTEIEVRSLLNDLMLLESSVDDAIDSLTPIELPSDEEIDKGSREYANINLSLVLDEKARYYRDFQKYDGHIAGAKWVMEQIKQQGIGH